MPAVKSRNSLPSTSWTHTPSPFAITSGYGRVKLVESAPWSRETSAAASGPGRVFAILGRRAPFGASAVVHGVRRILSPTRARGTLGPRRRRPGNAPRRGPPRLLRGLADHRHRDVLHVARAAEEDDRSVREAPGESEHLWRERGDDDH